MTTSPGTLSWTCWLLFMYSWLIEKSFVWFVKCQSFCEKCQSQVLQVQSFYCRYFFSNQQWKVKDICIWSCVEIYSEATGHIEEAQTKQRFLWNNTNKSFKTYYFKTIFFFPYVPYRHYAGYWSPVCRHKVRLQPVLYELQEKGERSSPNVKMIFLDLLLHIQNVIYWFLTVSITKYNRGCINTVHICTSSWRNPTHCRFNTRQTERMWQSHTVLQIIQTILADHHLSYTICSMLRIDSIRSPYPSYV